MAIIATTMGAYNYMAVVYYTVASTCTNDASIDGSSGGIPGNVDTCYIMGNDGFKIACNTDGTAFTYSAYSADTTCTGTPSTTPGATETCFPNSDGSATKYICSETPIEGPDNDEDDVCFSGSETLLLDNGQEITMDNVSIGDRVQVANNDGTFEFADVIALPHGKNQIETSFVELSTSTSSLKATPAHLIMAGSCDSSNSMTLVRTEDVNIGDCLASTDGPVEVVSSSMTKSNGIYTVVTSNTDGIIVVNGFKASSFAINHAIVNTYYNIHRNVYAFAPSLVKNLGEIGDYLAAIGSSIISA